MPTLLRRRITSDDGEYDITIDKLLSADVKDRCGCKKVLVLVMSGKLHKQHKTKPVQEWRVMPFEEPEAETQETTREEQDVIVKVFCTTGVTLPKPADTEVKALKKLTEAACEHAPRYLGDFVRQFEGITVAVREHYVLMTKVPGITHKAAMSDCTESVQPQQEAFEIAIRSLHAAGVDNHSHHYGNLIWDGEAKKCYIIDFERAEFEESSAWTEDFSEWF